MFAKSFLKNDLPTFMPNDVCELKDVILVDVRMPDEYLGELGHIEGTCLMIQASELDSFLASANKQSPIIFICRESISNRKERA